MGPAQSGHRLASGTAHPLPRIDVEKALAMAIRRADNWQRYTELRGRLREM